MQRQCIISAVPHRNRSPTERAFCALASNAETNELTNLSISDRWNFPRMIRDVYVCLRVAQKLCAYQLKLKASLSVSSLSNAEVQSLL